MGYNDRKKYSPTTSFRLPKETLNTFEDMAQELGTTKAKLMRYLIRCFITGKISPPDNK